VLERLRRRLTLGYVGIFALILVIIGAVAVVSFARQAATQQDELLEQKAQGTSDFVRGPLLHSYQVGRDPRDKGAGGGDGERPIGPIQSAMDTDIGVVALVPPDSADGEGEVLDWSPSASSFGLPFERAAQRAAQEGEAVAETVDGPEGEIVRVASVPVTGRDGGMAIVQAAQSRRVVWEAVGRLLLILVPVGIVGLILSGVGGLFMSRRAIQPVKDTFQRQRTFIADASHELKTPLALAKINAEVIKRNPTDPENREIIEDQLYEIDRMDTLLSDLLVLARLDAGRLDMDHKPFDLTIVAAETASRFLMKAAEEGVRLEVEVPDELPVYGDPDRTSQILTALLDNAMRHTPKGGSITISGRLVGGWAEANVTDTGTGIAPEYLPHVFDRFFRAEEARTRAGGGTGLGLSIARDLARAQDGELLAGNVPDGGARFTLKLPTGP
jgi:signal transduction histidine kinase